MSLRQCTPPRYLPLFSSRPGMRVAFPGEPYTVQAFPTLLRLLCQEDEELVRELHFPKLGAPRDWRVLVDAMRRTVTVEGKGAEGFFRLRIDQEAEGLSLRSVKGPLEIQSKDHAETVQRGEPVVLVPSIGRKRFPMPRLLLGCHKELNWDRISAHPDMNEILPLWYQFGSGEIVANEPSSTLFGAVVEAIQAKERKAVFPAFEALFRAGTKGIFVPKRADDAFLGYSAPAWPEEMELFALQNHLYSAIRSLFLIEEGSVVDLLPALPCESAAGRLLREQLSSGHMISIEWRKGQLRRVFVRAAHDGLLTVRALPKKGFLRALRGHEPKRPFLVGEPIEVRQGQEFLLDNFSME